MAIDERRLKVYTTKRCGDCMMTKAVLDRLGVVYEEIDIDQDLLPPRFWLLTAASRTVPTVLLPDGRVLVEPSRQILLSALGLPVEPLNVRNERRELRRLSVPPVGTPQGLAVV